MGKIISTERSTVTSKELAPRRGEEFVPLTHKSSNGNYYISNYGRVYSVPRVHHMKSPKGHTFTHRVKGGFLNPKRDSRGRLLVSIDGKLCLIHVLVGEMFVKKPKGFKRNKYILFRKDGSIDNCHADNLVWEELSFFRRHTDTFKCAVTVTDTKKLLEPMHFKSIVECASFFNASKQAVHQSITTKGHFRRRFIITRDREGFTLADKMKEQGGLKYKC